MPRWTSRDDVKVTEPAQSGTAGLVSQHALGLGHRRPRATASRLKTARHAGRLIVPGDHREPKIDSGKSLVAHHLFRRSRADLELGGGLVGISTRGDLNHANDHSNENTIVGAGTTGELYMSIRVQASPSTLARQVVQHRRRHHVDARCSLDPSLISSTRCKAPGAAERQRAVVYVA